MATDSLLFIAKESIVGPRHQLDRRKSDQFETDLQENPRKNSWYSAFSNDLHKTIQVSSVSEAWSNCQMRTAGETVKVNPAWREEEGRPGAHLWASKT